MAQSNGKDNKETSSINPKLWDIQVNCNNKCKNNELFLAAFPYCENQRLGSSYVSVSPHGTTRLPLGGFLWNLLSIFENLSGKFEIHLNMTRITSTLHEDQYSFLIVSRQILLRMRKISDKCCREKNLKVFGSSTNNTEA